MAVTTSESLNGYNNSWVRDNDESDGFVVPLNFVAVHVVIVQDDEADAGEFEREVAR